MEEKNAYQDFATTQDLEAPPENIEQTCISILRRCKILRTISRRCPQDLETSQDSDIHFLPHFHEGHQDRATSQHIDMLHNQNISPLLSQIWSYSCIVSPIYFPSLSYDISLQSMMTKIRVPSVSTK